MRTPDTRPARNRSINSELRIEYKRFVIEAPYSRFEGKLRDGIHPLNVGGKRLDDFLEKMP